MTIDIFYQAAYAASIAAKKSNHKTENYEKNVTMNGMDCKMLTKTNAIVN